MKQKLALLLFYLTVTGYLHAQDTYWAMKDNKVLNTRTGKICTQRSGDLSDIILHEGNAGIPKPNNARGVFDISGRSIFTFGETSMFLVDPNFDISVEYAEGCNAAFVIGNGRCKQYCLIGATTANRQNGLDRDRRLGMSIVDATATSIVDPMTQAPSVISSTVIFQYWGATNFAVCTAPAIGIGHYIYFINRVASGSGLYNSKIYRYTIDGDGNLGQTPYELPLYVPDIKDKTKLKISQDGYSLAYVNIDDELTILDAQLGVLKNSYPLGNNTVYGLEQTDVNTERRWYLCINNTISYVVESPAATAINQLVSFPGGLKTDLALGRDGNIYYATGDPTIENGSLWVFNPVNTGFLGLQIPNGSQCVFAGGDGHYSFGNLVTGEDNCGAMGYDNYGDYTIATSQTWDPLHNPSADFCGQNNIFRLEGTLTIAAGADVTIKDMKIEMGPNAQIVVEPSIENVAWAGYLTLDNTNITAYEACSYDSPPMWDGIRVSGVGNSAPQTYLYGAQHSGLHATLKMINNTTLSRANWAVMNSGPNDELTYTKGGGIILAENSSFIDNRRSVAYAPYHYQDPNNPGAYHPYRSSFTNCYFEVARDLPNGFSGFVTGWDVTGVTFRGCSFMNSSGVNSTYNWGIWGSGFGVLLDESSEGQHNNFENLKVAIDISDISGGLPVVDVRNSDFKNNDIGIRTRDVDLLTVYKNTFQIPDVTQEADLESAFGVYIESGTGYLVRDNEFTGTVNSADKYTTGVFIRNTGENDNLVHSNVYDKLTVGNLSNGDNRGKESGLRFQCNQYKNNEADEAARGGNTATDGISPFQGSLLISAGNRFSGSVLNLFNHILEVGPITYYHGGGVETPNFVVGNINLVSATENACRYPILDQAIPYDPNYGPGAKGTGNADKSLTEMLRSAANINEALTLLQGWKSPYSNLMQSDLLLQAGRTEEARQAFNSIPEQYLLDGDEGLAFTRWGKDLLELEIALRDAGRNRKGLNRKDVAVLEDIAANGTMWARIRAQNWLTLYDGRSFTDDVLFPQNWSGDVAEKAVGASNITGQQTVYPNPVQEYLTVNYNNDQGKKCRIVITDAIGRVLINQDLATGASTRVNVASLNNGVYFYQIIENNRSVRQGKITKN